MKDSNSMAALIRPGVWIVLSVILGSPAWAQSPPKDKISEQDSLKGCVMVISHPDWPSDPLGGGKIPQPVAKRRVKFGLTLHLNRVADLPDSVWIVSKTQDVKLKLLKPKDGKWTYALLADLRNKKVGGSVQFEVWATGFGGTLMPIDPTGYRITQPSSQTPASTIWAQITNPILLGTHQFYFRLPD